MLLHAERMEEEMLALERQLTGRQEALQGQLRLSASEWFSRLVLAPGIASFSLAHPLVAIELVVDSRVVDLARREADLVFRLPRFEVPDIVQRRFTRVRYDLFASPAYLEEHGTPVLAAQGRGHRLIGMDAALETQPDVPWLQGRLPRARLAVRSNSRDVQAVACAEGAGIAVLPRVLGESLGLVRLTLDEDPPSREIRLGYHADLKRLKRLRLLVDHLCTRTPEQI